MKKKTAGKPAAREIGEARGKPAGAIPATAALRLAAGMAACGLAAPLVDTLRLSISSGAEPVESGRERANAVLRTGLPTLPLGQ